MLGYASQGTLCSRDLCPLEQVQVISNIPAQKCTSVAVLFSEERKLGQKKKNEIK